MSLIHAEGLKKVYQMGEVSVTALRDIGFDIMPRSFVAIVGPSGSGKSTLLNLIGCLDAPSDGQLRVLETDISQLSRKQLAEFRGQPWFCVSRFQFDPSFDCGRKH